MIVLIDSKFCEAPAFHTHPSGLFITHQPCFLQCEQITLIRDSLKAKYQAQSRLINISRGDDLLFFTCIVNKRRHTSSHIVSSPRRAPQISFSSSICHFCVCLFYILMSKWSYAAFVSTSLYSFATHTAVHTPRAFNKRSDHINFSNNRR